MKTYQESVAALLKNDDDIHLVAGLAAECGEVCGLYQKASYKNTKINEGQMLSELGDVMFYLTAIISKWGYTLDEVQKINIEKLNSRYHLTTLNEEISHGC